MNTSKSQKVVLADLAIGGAILLLAYLLKDATPEAQAQGLVAIVVSIFLRLKRASKSDDCNRSTCLRGSRDIAGE